MGLAKICLERVEGSLQRISIDRYSRKLGCALNVFPCADKMILMLCHNVVTMQSQGVTHTWTSMFVKSNLA